MERGLALGVWVLVSTLGAVRGNSIQSQDPELSRTEGDSVTLRCSYSSNDDYVLLYWYRQYPNRAPQYILYRGAKSVSSASNTADFARNRFSSLADHSTTVLNITALEWADTAMYYCALGNTVIQSNRTPVQKPSLP